MGKVESLREELWLLKERLDRLLSLMEEPGTEMTRKEAVILQGTILEVKAQCRRVIEEDPLL